MWGDGGNFGGGGGGFMDNSFASPSAETGEKKNKDRRAENIVPVTIDQILKSEEDFKIGNVSVHVVTFVGMLRNIEMSSTKITYLAEDTTGQIEAVHWLDSQEEKEQPHLNAYYRFSGNVRVTQGKRHVLMFKMQPVTDLNELTAHLLEVIDLHQIAPNFSETESMDIGAPPLERPLENSMMNMKQMGSGLGQHIPTDPQHKQVFKVISDAAVDIEAGVDVAFITRRLNGRLNENQVRSITDYLVQEGFIFSTIDDEHFTVTH